MYTIQSCKTGVLILAIYGLGSGCGRSNIRTENHLASLAPREIGSQVEVYRGVNSQDSSQTCSFSIERDAALNIQEMALQTGYYKLKVTKRATEEETRETYQRVSFVSQPSMRYPGYTRIGYMLVGPSFWRLAQLPPMAAVLEGFSSGEVFFVVNNDFSKVIVESAGVPLGIGPRVAVWTVSCEQMRLAPSIDTTWAALTSS